MSTLDMYLRIQSAMPDDEEVQAFCRKYIERHGVRDALREEKLRNVRDALRSAAARDETPSAREVAQSLNSAGIPNGDKMLWTTQGAGYYLRELVSLGEAQVVEEKPCKRFEYMG